jgi:hypothetical protein
VLDHAAKFRFDRRLHLRRGWIPSEQFDKELTTLLDVSEKAEVVESPQSKGADVALATGDDGE